ncbi:dehydrogenase, PQQ-dependent, s-GDH family [Rodentibacter pneumotropicus]|uniref:Dehydrogenase, PQQ-dependent, s-GDH family n=1 Tax=Rodentibacter pneumotropicus TaxID=758 RepID=A0A3S4XZT4_9PAST|nr:dehydrogenase, PQQ-dependent, s-GDH family [Rodentibacter pneumotropicus]
MEGLQSPWDMAIDRNGQLWVTEVGGNILLVDAETGKHQVIHHFDDVVNGGQQQGLLGLTLDPNFLSGNGENVLYAAYAYKGKDGQEYTKIVKLTLDKIARKVEKQILCWITWLLLPITKAVAYV